jgi:hypothetical protein
MMRRRPKIILCAVACLLTASGALAAAPGQFVDWTRKDGPKTIALGGTSATITAAPCDRGGDVGDDCPHEERFGDFPTALRAFLVRTGYIKG